MKSLQHLLIVFLLFDGMSLHAQNNLYKTPKEQYRNFDHLPTRFRANDPAIRRIFFAEPGDSVSFVLHADLVLKGILTDKVLETGVQRVNIRSADYPGTIFNFSLSAQGSGPAKMQARVLNRQSGEVLLLSPENGSYYFEKKHKQKLIAE